MKRSLDSDEEIDNSKKSKNELGIDNNNYYIIRRSKSSVSSSNSNAEDKPFKFKNDKIDTKFNSKHDVSKQFGKSDKYSSFGQRDKNRFTPFNKSERNLSSSFHKSSNSFDKSKSTSALDDKKIEFNSVISNLTSTGYNIKLPSKFQSNNDKQTDISPSSSSSSYIIRKSDDKAKSDELKDQFHGLIKDRNLNYKLEYLVKLTVNGRIIESSNYDNVYAAENEAFSLAIKNLQQQQQITIDESMNEETNESIIINEIKQLLNKFDNKLLFKDEIPFEYKKLFKRNIINNWFDEIQNNASFKIERHAGNLASIKLL